MMLNFGADLPVEEPKFMPREVRVILLVVQTCGSRTIVHSEVTKGLEQSSKKKILLNSIEEQIDPEKF